MQPLLDGVRAALNPSVVRSLLQSQSALTIEYGAVGLDKDFNIIADLSSYLTRGGQITSDSLATIHRGITVNIDSDVAEVWDYLSGYIKPCMILSNEATGRWAQFNLGVYTLTTPSLSLATSPSTVSFTGYDLIYLLQQPVGDSYEVAAGVDPAEAAATAIQTAIPGISVNFTPSDSTLAKAMTFPFNASSPVTWLSIVTALLNAIGYRQVWVDWEGTFRIEPFTDPQTLDPEWEFSLVDDVTIVAEDRAQNADLFDVPNWFRFVMGNLTAPAVEGVTMLTYEDVSVNNPGSLLNRGRVVRHIETVTVATFADLQQYAAKTIAKLLKPSETFAMKTQPFPLAWHLDVLAYTDPNLAPIGPVFAADRKVMATNWTLPLDGETDMDWTLQTITDQSVSALLSAQSV
jgi:hypothetical protein